MDNHSSYCVSPSKKDFVGKLIPISANIRGIRGNVKIRYKGTVKWKWEDDLGQTTTHLVPNTLFMPTSPDRILSPQHWSQQQSDTDKLAHSITDHMCTKLVWLNGKHTKTFPLDPITNVATMQSTTLYYSISDNNV